jgi:cobalt/nickel transport system permease protein
MHIPDGYLGPIFSLGTAAATVPAWSFAVRRVQKVLNNRTVPLLAIFSAFTFTIMMFNIPVPGGTTAHGIGGALIAIVLGVPAAVIGVSMALILQALFFGDGGILAIFPNCFNMAVVLPLVGYWSYRLIAGSAPLLSRRRVWAAGIGAYVGMTVSALAVGIELGLQPLLFNEGGRPLYSPYGMAEAVPAMLLSHVFGASIVEAIITALGVAYMQKQFPEYLVSLRGVFAGRVVAGPERERRAAWPAVGAGITGGLAVLVVAGLVTGGGDVSHLFGADWSRVNWAGVAGMLLVVLVIAAVLVPLAWFALPRRFRAVGTLFTTLAVFAPLGLIAPGFAYGEGSAQDVQAAFGYIPKGLQDMSSVFSAPLSGYNLPLPFFSDSNAPLWRAAVGYEVAGVIGMLVVGGLVWGVAGLLRRRSSSASSEEIDAPAFRQDLPAA